ncbi:coat protein P3 [Barley yellow dwarf virus-kerIII]|nr:coat protein P3 [Barley yellow dwarf virus-kerIII]AGN54057.1 coat protein P3 [Barley yellow dwarf virus-kerIII]
MNSAGRRRNNRNVRKSKPKPKPRAVRTVVMVQPNGAGPRRRNNRRSRGRGSNPLSGSAGRSEIFVFSVDGLKTNSSGILKFGPGLSQCPALSGGILKSYHRYKIANVKIQYKSHASSTTTGAIYIELDTSCTQSALGSTINSFSINQSGSKTFNTEQIDGKDYRETTLNQFYLLYKGSESESNTAGQFIVTFRVMNTTPK